MLESLMEGNERPELGSSAKLHEKKHTRIALRFCKTHFILAGGACFLFEDKSLSITNMHQNVYPE